MANLRNHTLENRNLTLAKLREFCLDFCGTSLFTPTKLEPASLPHTTLKLGRTVLVMEAVQRGSSILADDRRDQVAEKHGGDYQLHL